MQENWNLLAWNFAEIRLETSPTFADWIPLDALRENAVVLEKNFFSAKSPWQVIYFQNRREKICKLVQ